MLALGLVAVIEGLVLALVPKRFEDALRVLSAMPVDTRRLFGIVCVALGVALVWLARSALLIQ